MRLTYQGERIKTNLVRELEVTIRCHPWAETVYTEEYVYLPVEVNASWYSISRRLSLTPMRKLRWPPIGPGEGNIGWRLVFTRHLLEIILAHLRQLHQDFETEVP